MDDDDSKRPTRRPRKRKNAPRVSPGGGWIPLQRALELLREYDVPGYGNRESGRQRVVEDGALPHKKVGGRYYVDEAAVHALIGAQSVTRSDPASEDQRLVRYFHEDPERDASTALVDGIARSFGHAQVVFAAYRASPSGAAAVAAARAKKQEEARLAEEAAALAWRCRKCNRSEQVGRAEHMQVIHDVTGNHVAGFDLADEYELGAFRAHYCAPCLRWHLTAPVAEMREHLERVHLRQEQESAAAQVAPAAVGDVPAAVAADRVEGAVAEKPSEPGVGDPS
jgi:hypothetical protein